MTSSKSFFATLILVGTLAVCNVGGCIIAAAGLIIAAIAEEKQSDLQQLAAELGEFPANPCYRNAEQTAAVDDLLVQIRQLVRTTPEPATANRARDLLCSHAASGHIRATAASPNGQINISADHNTLSVTTDGNSAPNRKLDGHRDWVTSVAACDHNGRVLSGSWDKTMKLWNVETGECATTFTGHDAAVSAVAFMPDHQRAMSASVDGSIKLWDLDTGQCLRTYAGHLLPVWVLSIRLDGKQLISKTEDGEQKTWNLRSGECLETIAPPKPATDEEQDDEDDDAEDDDADVIVEPVTINNTK